MEESYHKKNIQVSQVNCDLRSKKEMNGNVTQVFRGTDINVAITTWIIFTTY